MLKRLLGKKKAPVEVWVIKQVDADLLHLCDRGRIKPEPSRDQVLAALAEGGYQGAVDMASVGLVLNAKLFAALVPLDALTLNERGEAYWQGRTWRVSQVPQRCWTYEGRLVAQANPLGGGLVSAEDVTDIRQRVDRAPGDVPFASQRERDEPQLVPKDEPLETKDSPRPRRHEWRGSDR